MMKRSRKFMALVVCALMVCAVAITSRAEAAGDETPAVKIAEKEGIGRYLTDPSGMTLYYFTKDTPTTSACTGPCVDKWPLFHSEVSVVPAGCDVSDFDVINREDGKKQSTYKGKPLYYYYRDEKPGDTTGQGAGGVWYVVAP